MGKENIRHFMQVPFTGLGLYNGFRSERWLKNRIKIFKQFVVPSLQAQTNQDFTLWITWRTEERYNKQVLDLKKYLNEKGFNCLFTYCGCWFYDDKYPNEEAIERLRFAINDFCFDFSSGSDYVKGKDYVYVTIQPSDDCYHKGAVEAIQKVLSSDLYDAVGFKKGYISDYFTKEVSDYNPTTNPPFVTVKFPIDIFLDPLKHMEYTGIKHDII